MDSMLIVFFLFVFCGFAAMYVSLAPVVRKYMQTLQFKPYMSPILYIWLFYTIGSMGVYFLLENRDFIEPLTLWRVILPPVLALVIYIGSMFCSRMMFNVLLAAVITALVWSQPLGQGTPLPMLPNLAVKVIIAVIGFVFCRYYTLMYSSIQAYTVPLLMILAGFSVLSALGAAPMFVAICAGLLFGILGAYLALNYNEEKIGLDEGSCVTIAFLVFAIMSYTGGEFCFVSGVMFSMVFWAELAAALWSKLVITHSGSLAENSNYYTAGQKYAPHALALNILKICVIALFLGWFQLFSVNNYSLPLIAFLLILWLNHSLGSNSVDEPQNLREINQAFVADIKKNIQQAKEALQATKKDK